MILEIIDSLLKELIKFLASKSTFPFFDWTETLVFLQKSFVFCKMNHIHAKKLYHSPFFIAMFITNPLKFARSFPLYFYCISFANILRSNMIFDSSSSWYRKIFNPKTTNVLYVHELRWKREWRLALESLPSSSSPSPSTQLVYWCF